MKLNIIGLGPGSPDLLTVRAVNKIAESRVVFVPYSSSTGRSLAMEVVREYVKGKIVEVGFPMGEHVDETTLKELGEKICLEAEDPSAFVTLGDPVLYSTFYRVKKFLNCFSEYEIVPGVSSITACACRADINLASEKEAIAIIPSSRRDLLEAAKNSFETIVVIKGSYGLEEASQILKEYDITYARRCFMKEEKIETWKGKSDRDYFSMLIARRGE
jgi:precorrin-2/cobalt-factor-2 C20-methyltransferase